MGAGRITGIDPTSGASIAVSYANERILAIEPAAPGDGAYISAGLVDLQVNGYAGHDLNADPSPEQVVALTDTLRGLGVTTYLPTVITAGQADLSRRLNVIAEARRLDERTARAVPFVHLEGPWIAPEDGPRGAHPRAHVAEPSLEQFEALQNACGALIGLVTLSPHWPEAPQFIAQLVQRGVLVSIGHTSASAEQVRAAVDAGARLSTHLGNGSAAMLPRHPNFVWAQLADDRLTACFIADGHHLPADALTAMIRAKGNDRAILVSDSTALGGLPPGIYHQTIGGEVELSADGRLSMRGTPYLAGAALPLPDMVARAVHLAGVSLGEALRMASGNPGAVIGGRGQLVVGGPADIIRFHWKPGAQTLTMDGVIAGGYSH